MPAHSPFSASFLFFLFLPCCIFLHQASSHPPQFIRQPHFHSHPAAQRIFPRRRASIKRDDPPLQTYFFGTRFFTQTLDHFGFRSDSSQTFQQRYLISTQYWAAAERNGPIFFYCGNEGDILWFAENTGFMWELAPKHGAMLVFAEHRFYGESIPAIALENKTAETLGYLTSEQALADFVTLITDLKQNFSAESSPVVAFGGSYGGMLAAWFRLKYPHVVIGALSSSAPILQFDGIVPSDTFYRITSQNFMQASMSCFETIRDSWDALNASVNTLGLEELTRTLRFCSDANQDMSSIVDFFDTAWSTLAMTNYPYPADFVMPLPANPVLEACNAIDEMPNGTDILSRVLAGANVFWNSTGDVECFDTNSDPHGEGLWDWQTCTEMVMPFSSDPANSMYPSFSYNLEEKINSCNAEYGATPRPHWITQEFGGHDIKTVLQHFGSNIVFSNGLLDPWSGGGVLQTISKTIVALVTQQGAHHLDLRPSTLYDPPWLMRQRKQEESYIKHWIQEYYKTHNLTVIITKLINNGDS